MYRENDPIPRNNIGGKVSKGKVQLFWEGHKNLRNLPHGLYIYLVTVQTMRKIVQIFVAFSEKLNFFIEGLV